jgi:hypothetical protein
MSDKPPNDPDPNPNPDPAPHPVPDPVDPNRPVGQSSGHGRVHVLAPGEVVIDGRSSA